MNTKLKQTIELHHQGERRTMDWMYRQMIGLDTDEDGVGSRK